MALIAHFDDLLSLLFSSCLLHKFVTLLGLFFRFTFELLVTLSVHFCWRLFEPAPEAVFDGGGRDGLGVVQPQRVLLLLWFEELENRRLWAVDEVADLDTVAQDAVGPLGVLSYDVVVDGIDEGDDRVDGEVALHAQGGQARGRLVQAELAVPRQVVRVVGRVLVLFVLHKKQVPVQTVKGVPATRMLHDQVFAGKLRTIGKFRLEMSNVLFEFSQICQKNCQKSQKSTIS